MKNKISILIGTVLAAMVINTPAQSVPATPQSSFAQSALDYFSSFNTNSTTFQTERAEIWTATDQNNGALSAVFGLQYNIKPAVSVEALIRNAAVLGTVQTAQAGIGYNIVHYDTKVVFGLDGGYRLDHSVGFIEPYIDLRKALTDNTYSGIRLYYQQTFTGSNTGAHAPGVMIILGCKL